MFRSVLIILRELLNIVKTFISIKDELLNTLKFVHEMVIPEPLQKSKKYNIRSFNKTN